MVLVLCTLKYFSVYADSSEWWTGNALDLCLCTAGVSNHFLAKGHNCYVLVCGLHM